MTARPWTAAEEAIVRAYPLAEAVRRLPHRTYTAISQRRVHLGCAVPQGPRPPVSPRPRHPANARERWVCRKLAWVMDEAVQHRRRVDWGTVLDTLRGEVPE